MTKDAKVFLDTNVLLRATINAFPEYTRTIALIAQQHSDGKELWISRQVIREYIAQVTRPQSFMKPMTAHQVVTQVSNFYTVYKVADETAPVTAELLKLIKAIPTGGKQIHDANIVATMLAYNIDTLITQNMEDMKRFDGKIPLVPLI